MGPRGGGGGGGEGSGGGGGGAGSSSWRKREQKALKAINVLRRLIYGDNVVILIDNVVSNA